MIKCGGFVIDVWVSVTRNEESVVKGILGVFLRSSGGVVCEFGTSSWNEYGVIFGLEVF